MSKYTDNLNLYEKEPDIDGNDTFNITTMMNDNWDKIDSATGKLANLTTSVKNNLVSSTNEVNSKCGTLANLTTTAKDNLVVSINEVNHKIDTLDLSGKMNTSANNATSTGKSTMVGWTMPDYNSASSRAMNTNHSENINGWLILKVTHTTGGVNGASLSIDNVNVLQATSSISIPNGGGIITVLFIAPVGAGSVYKASYTAQSGSAAPTLQFCSCIGG